MALKVANMVKNVSGDDKLELRANVGESLLVKGIYAVLPASDFITVKIDKTTVGYFKTSSAYGNHLWYPRIYASDNLVVKDYKINLLDMLYEKGIFTGYPIAEGETFNLSYTSNEGNRVTVLYDVYDAGDKKAEDVNGSKSKEYFIVNYGDTGAPITASGDFLYNNPLNPVEFPRFPYGGDVPAKTEITIYGVLGKEIGVINNTPALAIYTNYLKFVYEREILFDNDRNGLLFDGSNASGGVGVKHSMGYSLIGDYSHKSTKFPYFFPQPLVFASGEELNIYVSVTEVVDGSSIATGWQTIGLIQKIKRGE